jgi:hypothetical protein
MIDKRRMLKSLHPLALAHLVLGASGCSEELGPEPMPVASVKGVLSEGGRPCSKGWVEFFPIDGTIGNLRSARVHSDGSFEADKVPVGLNLIRLVDVPLNSPAARQIFGAYTSPIRHTIPSEPSESLVIDVFDETIRFQQSRTRRAGLESRGSGDSR